MSSEPTEFPLVAYDGTPRSTGPMTVTVDTEEIRWTSPKTSGRVGYHQIASIALILGDPDGGQRDDHCIISTAAGLALKVYCETDRSALAKKFRPARREAYSNFVQLLHRQLSPEDRHRIAFKTDGKLTNKAQWFPVGGWLVSSAALIVLLIEIGHPMALGFAWSFIQVVYGVMIYKFFPKEPALTALNLSIKCSFRRDAGGGLLFDRHKPPITRHFVAYYCSAAAFDATDPPSNSATWAPFIDPVATGIRLSSDAAPVIAKK